MTQLPAILFFLPLFAAIIMPMLCMKHTGRCWPLACATVSLMACLAIVNLFGVLRNGTIRYAFSGWPPPGGIEWVADGLASVMLVVLSLLGVVTLVYTRTTFPADVGRGIVYFYALVLLLISSLSGIVFAGDLFNLFVFLEVAALAGYALVGIAGGPALVAAFRYLILGTLGASLYLLGVSYFYAATGTLNMADMAAQLPHLLSSKAVLGGLLFMFIGLGIKMALVPLHAWLPDAYTFAPESVSPILASLVTKVALFGWIRIIFWVLGADAIIYDIPILLLVDILGVLAAIIGAFLALTQEDVKRMFAYGGISHIGIILIGVSQGNRTGFAGGLFYLLNDAVMQAALFFVAGLAVLRSGSRHLDSVSSLRQEPPWIIVAFVVMAMSMIGLPPTGGFFGKWYIVLGALEAQNYWAVGAVIFSTILTLAYFVKLFERVFRHDPPLDGAHGATASPPVQWSLGVVTAAIVVLGLWSDPIVGFLLNTALPEGL